MTRIENDLEHHPCNSRRHRFGQLRHPATTLATTPTKPASASEATESKTEAKPAAKQATKPAAAAKNGKPSALILHPKPHRLKRAALTAPQAPHATQSIR